MKGISSRERVVIALSHQEPDKVPIDIGEGRQTSIYVEPYVKTMQALGFGAPEIVASPRGVVDRFDERFLQKLEIDFRRVAVRGIPEDQVAESDGTFSDEWGIRWKKVGYFVSPVHHPLKDATIDDLKRYRWPDPTDQRRFQGLGAQAGPYRSRDMYREIIKPHERRFMSAIKNKTEAKILHHSDGAITSFIDDLIEIGVDILNPVQ